MTSLPARISATVLFGAAYYPEYQPQLGTPYLIALAPAAISASRYEARRARCHDGGKMRGIISINF